MTDILKVGGLLAAVVGTGVAAMKVLGSGLGTGAAAAGAAKAAAATESGAAVAQAAQAEGGSAWGDIVDSLRQHQANVQELNRRMGIPDWKEILDSLIKAGAESEGFDPSGWDGPTPVDNTLPPISGEIDVPPQPAPATESSKPEPTVEVKGPHWHGTEGPPQPAIVFRDREGIERLITVRDGQAFYQSSGTNLTTGKDGVLGYKSAGAFYPFYGIQEAETSYLNKTRGFFLKGSLLNLNDRLDSVAALLDTSYDVIDVVDTPEKINEFLRRHGARHVYTSMKEALDDMDARLGK
jgi:hypothetical protein